jgi:dTDP-4-dehydrorhamnose 3,5-epimerase-like enzyme
MYCARDAGVQPVTLTTIGDDRGRLSVAEVQRDIPFDIRRVYWITSIPPSAIRGGHAHRRVHEAVIAVAGRFVARCEDADGRRCRFALHGPGEGIVIPPLVWRELVDFRHGSVCLVLASDLYDDAEYIRNRSEYESLVSA